MDDQTYADLLQRKRDMEKDLHKLEDDLYEEARHRLMRALRFAHSEAGEYLQHHGEGTQHFNLIVETSDAIEKLIAEMERP